VQEVSFIVVVVVINMAAVSVHVLTINTGNNGEFASNCKFAKSYAFR